MADRTDLSEADRQAAGALIGGMTEMDFTHLARLVVANLEEKS